MSIRESIFGGYHEAETYKHIKSVWNDQVIIYPQIPFASIFNIDTLDVNKNEREFLLKTSIDYTVCEKINGKPLLCIEFDGMGHGYNRNGQYIQIIPDSKRKWKLNLKLKMAQEDHFPFYIVSYEEKKYLTEKIHLTVIDSIIGQSLARLNLDNILQEYMVDSKNIIDALDEHEKHDYFQDMVISAEVVSELTWDPIVKKAGELDTLLRKNNININKWGYRYLEKPELPEMKSLDDIETLEKRIEKMKEVEWVGCEIYCETSKGTIYEKAWIRNFEGEIASPLVIVQNIVELMLLYKVAFLFEINIP
jgi:hypothetical protein